MALPLATGRTELNQPSTPPLYGYGPSSCLYDAGEESWPVKFHLGCGGIYLQGYTNVDIAGVMATDAAEQCEANRTHVGDYYARLTMRGPAVTNALPARRPTVCDVAADLTQYPLPWPVDKIIAIQVLEHFSPVQALQLLTRWHDALYVGRPLVLSVPDMGNTLNLLQHGGEYARAFAVRHLRGSGRDPWNWHKAWYLPSTLAEMLASAGFRSVVMRENFHDYPAIVVKAYA